MALDSQPAIADGPFVNPVWAALHSTHAHFALRADGVCKYPAEVAPFAAVAVNDNASLRRLHSLSLRGEGISLIGERPAATAGFDHIQTLLVLQMIYPIGQEPPRGTDPAVKVHRLSDDDAPSMVALTDLAFPGFFRRRTCEMGTYYGVFEGNQLIAMAGERMAFDHWREVSGVCTHPAHTGKGLAATLIVRVMRDHFENRLQSFLHVTASNERAIALYERLGYSLRSTVHVHQIRRVD